MQIKKSTLRLIISSLAITIIAGAIGLPIYFKQRKEQQRSEEIRAYVNKAIEKEYKDLLYDYNHYVKEALDYSNSNSSRELYIRKINQLLGCRGFYCRDSYSPSSDFPDEYKAKNDEAKSILLDKARENVRKALLQ